MIKPTYKTFSHCFLLLCGLLVIACSPFNDEDYFEPEKTNSYTLDFYQGDTGFQLDSSYAIDNTLFQEINLESNDGKSITNIVGIYVGDVSKINANKVIVYCHDKSKNIDYYWPRIKLLAKIGLEDYGIFIVDYRGYGKSEDSPDENGFYADVNAAIVWLEEQGLSSDRLIMYGYGLGSAVAVELTESPRSLTPAKIILEAPIASFESLIQDTTLQSTPPSYLSDLDFNNVDKMKNITQPLMWIHGSEDNVYDINTQGQFLYDQHSGTENIDKFSYRIEGANHENIPQKFDNGLDGYVFNILTFVSND